MRIGIWLDKDYKPEDGGGFSYYDRLIKAIDAYVFDAELDICFVSESQVLKNIFSKTIISLSFTERTTFIQKLLNQLPMVGKRFRYKSKKKNQAQRKSEYTKTLEESSVKFIYYLRQSECALPEFPFVATNWDIGHSSTYAFPELISEGEYERRTRFYNETLPRALMVFAESNAGKAELIKFTRLDESKIRVVPIFAGNCVTLEVSVGTQHEILSSYNLKSNEFFFYPAQFWAHKNHYALIQAFSEFAKQKPDFKLVFTGSDKGNLDYIKSVAEKFGVFDKVLFLGFVPMEHINTFFKNATALVMASFFGPTNMPPLEAMELGCPVLCTDIEGHKEILGDAAIYFQAMESETLLIAMHDIMIKRDEYKRKLIALKLNSIFRLEPTLKRIDKYLKQVVLIRQNWN